MSMRYKGGVISATAPTTSGTAYTGVATGVWTRQQQMQAQGASAWPAGLTVPGAPTIGTATGGNTLATVAFTAPSSTGGSAITSYTATSSPGGITGSGSSSPVTVSGLTNGTAYTFTVKANNAQGASAASAASNSATPAIPSGQQTYTSGSYTWVAPACITSASVLVVGSAYQGNGGALSYKNNITVVPGNSYNVVVTTGGTSSGTCKNYFCSTSVVSAGTLGYRTGCGGGNGGAAGTWAGGGAGGYSGNGGAGCGGGGTGFGANGAAATGGGGGGGSYVFYNCGTAPDPYPGVWYSGSGGGGVGLLGAGSSGNGGVATYGGPAGGGGGGSSGVNGTLAYVGCANPNYKAGGNYGGAHACKSVRSANGAVRIIWPGTSRSFPSTNTGNL